MQCWFLVKLYLHKTAQICQVINKVKQLTNIISDRGTVWIDPLQMLFIHFANTYKRGAGHVEIDENISKIKSKLGNGISENKLHLELIVVLPAT